LDEKPIFPSKPINCETMPDLISSNRYRAINVAAISTRICRRWLPEAAILHFEPG